MYNLDNKGDVIIYDAFMHGVDKNNVIATLCTSAAITGSCAGDSTSVSPHPLHK